MKLTQIRINRLANSFTYRVKKSYFQIVNVQNANSIFQLTYSSSYPLLINPLKFQTSNEKFLPNITWINHELNRSPQINSGQFEGKNLIPSIYEID